ncbi:testis-specific serine kinase substrate [Hyla sarda]|uniref:testis-specific serine kinase substrate n=1 Tax=Hyla sarda TaxID=327740 RepID=UPI0024C44A95|nr:testis-specific serine kinase substrate [Hyla sarda]
MIKTVFQSQEIKEEEKDAIVQAPFDLLNKDSGSKDVSFYRVKAPLAADSMSWCLKLKRSSASTNVSVMNLAQTESLDIKTSGNSESSSSESEEESAETQFPPENMMNSGLMFANDSVTNLKKKSSKLNHHVHSLKSESLEMFENLEQRQEELDDLDEICDQLEKKFSSIAQKLENIYEKRERLNNLKYNIQRDMSSLQRLLQTVESRNETARLRDLNQNMVSLCIAIKELKRKLETSGHRAESGRAGEKQMTILITATEEIRNSTAQISANLETTSVLLNNMHRTVFHMNSRIESVISQGSCAQEQKEPQTENIQELRASGPSSQPSGPSSQPSGPSSQPSGPSSQPL